MTAVKRRRLIMVWIGTTRHEFATDRSPSDFAEDADQAIADAMEDSYSKVPWLWLRGYWVDPIRPFNYDSEVEYAVLVRADQITSIGYAV